MQQRLWLNGETNVKVWGKNFLNFDELSICNFCPVSPVAVLG